MCTKIAVLTISLDSTLVGTVHNFVDKWVKPRVSPLFYSQRRVYEDKKIDSNGKQPRLIISRGCVFL